MIDRLKVLLTFSIIVILLRKKLNIGLVMLIASVALFLLYRMPFSLILATCKGAVLNQVTIKLLLALSLIRMFELILREHGVLKEMMGAVKTIFRNRKMVTVSMPLMIGLI